MDVAQAVSKALELRFEDTFTVGRDMRPLSSKTVIEHHRLISTVLEQAVKEGIIPFNPTSRTEHSKAARKEVNYFQPETVAAIRDALEQEPIKWRTLTHVFLITGARRGEVLGLKWDSVDFKANKIHICNSILYSPDVGIYEDTPKTERSNRYITLPQETMNLLRQYDEDMDDEPEIAETAPPPTSVIHRIYEQAERYRKAKKTLYDEDADMDEKQSTIEMLERLWDEGYTIVAHQLGKVYRDGLSVPADWVKAEGWFRKSAERGTVCSAYALGKLLLPVGLSTEAIRWLKYAADSGDQYAQYTLGKLYLLDREVPPDREAAVYYLTQSAEQGNRYAQFFLDHLDDIRNPSVGLAALRMFHHMANIFRDTTAQDSTHMGLHIDRKRRRELQEKRIAMGHKPDDHEDERMNQTMR